MLFVIVIELPSRIPRNNTQCFTLFWAVVRLSRSTVVYQYALLWFTGMWISQMSVCIRLAIICVGVCVHAWFAECGNILKLITMFHFLAHLWWRYVTLVAILGQYMHDGSVSKPGWGVLNQGSAKEHTETLTGNYADPPSNNAIVPYI